MAVGVDAGPRSSLARAAYGSRAAFASTALRESLQAFFSSRLLVWAAGIGTALIVGVMTRRGVALDPAGLTTPFSGKVPNLLVAPAARYDSVFYLGIAKLGYAQNVDTVFFPLYPLAVAFVSASGLPGILAGVLLSCCFAIGALFLLHRLVELDFGRIEARNTVWIVAWLPTAIFLSAVYSEALFLLLSVGSFYSGRLGRWWLAGLLGALAAATRNSGMLMVAPLLAIYLYGPRRDRPPDREPSGLRPRYAVRRDIAWIALVPLGLLCYLLYLHFATGHPFAPFTDQRHWHRSFIPLAGIPLGVFSVLKSVIGSIPGVDSLLAAHLTPLKVGRHLVELAFLIGAGVLVWYGRRRLPMPYTVLAVVSLAMTVSVPSPAEPLKSLPRFTMVIFPLWIALALWATEKNRVRAVLIVCAPLIITWTWLFTSWRWAA
jgi:Mannosyltransferase (PIG-V)